MHLKSSDWYAHGHERDPNYDNVILHAVWEDNVAVFRKDGSEVPTLELQHLIPQQLLEDYRSLFGYAGKKFINCEKDLEVVDAFLLDNWLERLFFERLQEKSRLIFELLEASRNDWEKVLFCLLMKNFGLNTNGAFFLRVALAVDFSVVRKIQQNPLHLEALLFGMVGLLQGKNYDAYFSKLKTEFQFLSQKFDLDQTRIMEKPKFHGLRPRNFPTIRLAQIAQLYAENQNLFQKIIETNTVDAYYKLFQVSAGNYWDNHYVFGKESKGSKKKLSKKFIDLLVINTIVPLQFCYGKKTGRVMDEDIIALMMKTGSENNTIIQRFREVGWDTKNALQSQAKLHLHTHYCIKNRCLECAVGTHLLSGNL